MSKKTIKRMREALYRPNRRIRMQAGRYQPYFMGQFDHRHVDSIMTRTGTTDASSTVPYPGNRLIEPYPAPS